ncbi:hypothetical protein [Puniceicoccus vermicola]|uniref:Uncharacterized protein n=1 Tax=Puniceicoccus vermicola TaxID=388746 RepID=A0A7X1E671_9BACT|nr:hypothetical protein [Puniceicoccus vermicola]MBC2604385.1 hypothetical protein [Puniceicoccus vermicola]
MKHITILLLLAVYCQAHAHNRAVESPITMEQLMHELEIQGGNWNFTFEKPVLAYVVFEISTFPNGEKKEVTTFISDKPSKKIAMFFSNSPFRVGNHPDPNRLNEKKMKIWISNCKATEGTRILWYTDKFSTLPWVEEDGLITDSRPCIPEYPALNYEYVLASYFREGDPYVVEATISFIEKKSDTEKIRLYDRNTNDPHYWSGSLADSAKTDEIKQSAENIGPNSSGSADVPLSREIILRATDGSTYIRVKDSANDETLGQFALRPGDSRTIAADGEVVILYTEGKFLEIERGDETYTPSRSGIGKIRIQ